MTNFHAKVRVMVSLSFCLQRAAAAGDASSIVSYRYRYVHLVPAGYRVALYQRGVHRHLLHRGSQWISIRVADGCGKRDFGSQSMLLKTRLVVSVLEFLFYVTNDSFSSVSVLFICSLDLRQID